MGERPYRGSRAIAKSDCMRNSPGRGERTSAKPVVGPGFRTPLSKVSMKNWVSNLSGVESNGDPCTLVGLVRGYHRRKEIEHTAIPAFKPCWAAMEWDAKRSTVSSALKPASAMRSKIRMTVFPGPGTRLGGEAWEVKGLPARNSSLGAPGQLATPAAAAN